MGGDSPGRNVVPKSGLRARWRALVDAHGDNVMLIVGTILVFWGLLWSGYNIMLIGMGTVVILLEIIWTAKRGVENG